MNQNRLIVITGGPGSGKTTLIEALAARGYATMPESGRAIIRDQVRVGGRALPWEDRNLFAELMLAFDMRAHSSVENTPQPVFFDRGVPDVLGYLRLCKLEVPGHVTEAVHRHRYAPPVFVAPFWPEIFRGDSERRQGFEEARATCEIMADTYAGLGYRPIRLPKASTHVRVRFVMDQLSAN